MKTVKEIMTKNPISIDKNILTAKALSIMNSKKITSYVFIMKKIDQKLSELFIFIIFYNQIFLK